MNNKLVLSRSSLDTEILESNNLLKSLTVEIEIYKNNSLNTTDDRNTVEAKISALNSSITDLHNTSRKLDSRLSAVAILNWHKFSTEGYDSGTLFKPRHDFGRDIIAEAKQLCGDEIAVTFLVDDGKGGKCGYANYVVACLRD